MAHDTDVCIVGAGPTGLAMALQLKRYGVRSRIIDKALAPAHTSKALVVQARTLELLEEMDLAENEIVRGVKVQNFSVFSERKRIRSLNFASLRNTSYPYLLFVPQYETEQVLSERLTDLGTTVERGVELIGSTQDETGVEVVLRQANGSEERLQVGWLIACDGPHSTVRHHLGIPFAGRMLEEVFALADVHLDWSMPSDMAALFLHEGALVGYFPRSGGLYRIIISYPPRTQVPKEVTLEEIQRSIDACGPDGARAHDPTWLSRFVINQRKVKHYVYGRVFLAGDAAHIHSPIGGQGMNTGIQDAFNLSWKLALVIAGRAPQRLLQSYDAEREPVGRNLLHATDLATRLALLEHPMVVGVRDAIARLASAYPPVQKSIVRAISQLAVAYPQSPIVHECRSGSLRASLSRRVKRQTILHAGERAPDGLVQITQRAAPVRLFPAILRGIQHHLLVFASQHTTSDDQRQWREIFKLIADDYRDVITAYLVIPHTMIQFEEDGITILRDHDGALYQSYGMDEGGVVLIRPDGYIGLLCQPVDVTQVSTYLDSFFISPVESQIQAPV